VRGASTPGWWYGGPCLCLALAVFGLLVGRPTPGAGSPSGQPADVADVYRRDCATCHGPEAAGTERGPDLAGSGLGLVDFMVRTGRMPIADPDDRPRRGPPAYDDRTSAALVAYVGGLQGGAVAAGPPIPSVEVDGADVPNGASVWRLNCAACHQWSGNGGALSDQAAPDVRHATATEIAEVVRSGPGSMPSFGTSAVDRGDLDDLAAYMTGDLDHPSDPGGWSLGHVGPVAEGAMALVAGLGLLAVVCRLLGEGRDPGRPVRSRPGGAG
jgi:ubiquinol-cytochrome c reductase cytochrome c subunit